ncbi:MAG: ABC transporter permease [Chloroflexi bacterium]|nr:ABC transporter permease [Chloroflexota bacterium]
MRKFPINPGIPIIILSAFVVTGIFADLIAPYSPTMGSLPNKLLPPGSAGFLLGTDQLGRDIVSRIIFGSRVSLSVSLLAIGIGATVGTMVGLIAGYIGGKLDSLLMRLTDIALSIPTILLAIVAAVALGSSYRNVILIIGLLLWPRFARQLRGEALAVKQADYVSLARVAGCSSARIICKHIFPNVVPTLLVLCTLETGHVILLEASLSFLGVGVPPPTPSWGGMVAYGRTILASSWWVTFLPGLAILLTVLAINFFGDWVRDKLDPKLRQV